MVATAAAICLVVVVVAATCLVAALTMSHFISARNVVQEITNDGASGDLDRVRATVMLQVPPAEQATTRTCDAHEGASCQT